MTNREVISGVRSSHKLFSDASLNDRSILAELRNNAVILINQKSNQRKLWGTDTIFTPIDCIEMEQVPMGECCDHASTALLSKSKLPMPTIIEGNYQYLIQGVYDIGSSQKLKYTPLSRYLNLLKLKLLTNDVYYWIHKSHLYISSPHVQFARMDAAVNGDVSYALLYPDCDCGGNRDKKPPCTSRLDEEFKCPGNLIGAVVALTSKSLLQNYFRLPVDHTSDNKDDQTNKQP